MFLHIYYSCNNEGGSYLGLPPSLLPYKKIGGDYMNITTLGLDGNKPSNCDVLDRLEQSKTAIAQNPRRYETELNSVMFALDALEKRKRKITLV